MLKDPVCGMEFTEAEAVELGAERVLRSGTTHWFCCPTCRKEWEAKHPE